MGPQSLHNLSHTNDRVVRRTAGRVGCRSVQWGVRSQSLDTDMQRLFYSTWPPSFSSHIRGGERRWPQNKTGVVHRYQATVCEVLYAIGLSHHPNGHRRNDNVTITSKRRRGALRRRNDVFIASCARCNCVILLRREFRGVWGLFNVKQKYLKFNQASVNWVIIGSSNSFTRRINNVIMTSKRRRFDVQ